MDKKINISKMADKVEVSVIVLNYRTKELSQKCVESLFKFTKNLSFEVLLIDNNSEDGSYEYLRDFEKKFGDKRLKVIFNKTNSGFSGGNNVGIKNSRGEYILFLNSDTELIENSVLKALETLKKSTSMGAIGCQLQNLDGSLQQNGGFFPTLARAFAWMFFIDKLPILKDILSPYHLAPSTFKKSHYQDWLTGAFFLVSRKVLDKVGVWDEAYFMYVEDVDLCWRIKQSGLKLYYLADTRVKHVGSASSSSERSILSELRNIKLFYRKHMPTWQMPFLVFLLKSGSLLRLILFGRGIYAKAFTSI
jgi:GT2 family glycosyltransferase